jgi:hypothetical protein
MSSNFLHVEPLFLATHSSDVLNVILIKKFLTPVKAGSALLAVKNLLTTGFKIPMNNYLNVNISILPLQSLNNSGTFFG